MSDAPPKPPTAADVAAARLSVQAASPAGGRAAGGITAPHNTPAAGATPQGMTPANSFRIAATSSEAAGGDDDLAAQVQQRLGQLQLGGSPTEIIDIESDDGEALEEVLPFVVKKRVRALRALQEQREQVDAAYRAERLALETKFKAQIEPLHQQRADIVAGRVEPEAPVVEGEEKSEQEAGEDEDADIVGVPDFWLGVLTNSSEMGELIEEHDVDVLHHLVDVRVVDADDLTGFRLEFHFEENPFFENDVLAKEYDIPNLMEGGEPYLNDMRGTEIRWKEGRDVSTKQVRKGKGKNKKVVEEPQSSFFNFFSPPPLEEMANLAREDAEMFLAAIDQDVSAGVLLREKIVPNAVLWYTGEMGDDSDEEDSDEDDEFDEDDDDEDDEGPFRPTTFGSGAPNGGEAPENPECKQQ